MSLSLSHGKALDVGVVGIDQAQLPPWEQGPIDLHGWFAAPSAPLKRGSPPLELEIGSGKGTFLVQQAALFPQVDFIGLEWARGFWRFAADRCRRRGLTNVRLVHIEAGLFVRNYVPDACLRQVHIYFPDPWPKKRHHKRRLVQAEFLRELWRVLEDRPVDPPPGPPEEGGLSGCVRIATDHSDYYQWMLDHAAQVADLFEPLPFESPESAGEGEIVGTNFERKYRREGRPFHGMILRKK
ncbi:MAG: hypothetical protein WD042_06580 [Phycisphaeraceae bacterium]